MRVLAIDPGYERIGIAIIDEQNGKEIHQYSDCFRTPADIPFSERLAMIGTEIERVISVYTPEALAIETLYFTSNQKTAMLVAEARGVILYIAAKNNLALYEYTPLQIKAAVTGDGRSDKEQVTRMVTQLLKIEKHITHDDEYDAIAIGLTCLATRLTR